MTQNVFLWKISKDILIALVVIYFFLLIPELVLPGIVSSHFSPKYFLVFIIAAALFRIWLGKKFPVPGENNKFRAISKNLTNAILAVSAVLIVLGLYKMKIWQIIVVTLLSLGLFVVSADVFVREDEEEQKK